MNNDLMKSLIELIDETLVEVEELKKSDRFSAAEVKLEAPGESLVAGMDANGSIKKDEEESEEEESEEEKKKKEEAKKALMNKGVNEEPKMKKDEDEEEEEEEEEKDEKSEPKEGCEIKKSEVVNNDLMKSMVEARVKPLEDKIETLINMVKQFADAPQVRKSVSYKDVTPLAKSEEVEPLSKAQILDKLFDLKKSGAPVDTSDIAHVEIGNQSVLTQIVAKYNIK